jgi:hypothetical protein
MTIDFRALMLACAVTPMLATAAAAQGCPDPAALTRGAAEPLATIRFLSDDALEGRLAGSAAERCAGDYIAARFRALGLRPAGADGTFFQDVPLASVLNPHAVAGTGRNVVALLQGSDAALAQDVIVIGAHYDHLGMGGPSSRAPGESAVHNGADDNASGVAALLHAASLLRDARPARSILFIAFTGEESGLLGSRHYLRNATVPVARMRAMINMDMVGRLGDAALIVNGVETAKEWRALLQPAADRLGLGLAMSGNGDGPSDHAAFYETGIPVVHFFTNTHAEYHMPGDDWSLIDAAGVETVARLTADVAANLAGPPATITFQAGAASAPRAQGSGSGAWLGTVPDFTPVATGVLLGGVTAGSPGESAGMKKGDVLIGLGGHDVADLQGFTDALSRFRPGQEVEVVVLRDGREVRLKAVLGARAR